tara:strand:+ start:332 stop:1900 length:1569 start_codon:yes stop_codon:yes gene_type:complete
MTARERYNQLVTDRQQFLDKAVDCSKLTLPYLIQDDTSTRPTHESLNIPWQSVGAKCVVALAAKLMLAILPPQATFFKLQVRDDKLGEDMPPDIRSELDLSFSKMERMVMDYIAASNDRVVIHQALKHLIVGGNALLFMGKDGIKNYPLTRYVVNRDGNGNVLEIVTKELIHRDVLGFDLPKKEPNTVVDKTYGTNTDDVEVYTCVKLQNGRWVWYQEVEDMIIPGSRSTAPKNASPWLVLTFNSVDGEQYGRGRVEEFLGDLKSLEGLSQALVEGAAAASKVIFLVSPSSTTKPATIAKAGNGAIVQGRAEDVQVVQVGKTADFSTAAQMAQTIERRLLEAFLVMNVRNAERVTAEEVRLTQLELEQQLGGIFSLLTVSFLIPYLSRTLLVLQRSNEIPNLPKDIVRPTIVAGINALGRGQDRESLSMFVGTIAQTLGPEALMKYINPEEAIKRLAAAQGIDILNLVKTEAQMAQEKEMMMQQQQNQTLLEQTGQLANSKLADGANLQDLSQAIQPSPPQQ